MSEKEWQGPKLTPAGSIPSAVDEDAYLRSTGTFEGFSDSADVAAEQAWAAISPAQERRVEPEPKGLLTQPAVPELPAHASPEPRKGIGKWLTKAHGGPILT